MSQYNIEGSYNFNVDSTNNLDYDQSNRTIDSKYQSDQKDTLNADKLAMKLKEKKDLDKKEQQAKLEQKLQSKGVLESVFDFVFGSSSNKSDQQKLVQLKSENRTLRNMQDTLSVAIGKQQYVADVDSKKTRSKENSLIDDKSSVIAKQADVADGISKLIGKGIDLK